MSDVIQLERQLSDAKELIANREMAAKLTNNREFKKLILEEYMIQEPARLVAVAGDPKLTPQQRADAMEMAKAAGHLKRYLHVIFQMANTAEADMSEIEEQLAEARAEDEAEASLDADTADNDSGGLV